MSAHQHSAHGAVAKAGVPYYQPGTAPSEDDYQRRFKSRGISRRQADLFKCRRVGEYDGREMTGFQKQYLDEKFEGIAIPNFWPGEFAPRAWYLRRDHPKKVRNSAGQLKDERKYVCHPGTRNMLLFSPDTDPAWLIDSSLPILIVEGPFKVMACCDLAWHGLGDAADRPRWLVIGVLGVWSWRGKVASLEGPKGEHEPITGVIPDFDKINWKEREVIILFDANVRTNQNVRIARDSLAKELRERHAYVRYAEL